MKKISFLILVAASLFQACENGAAPEGENLAASAGDAGIALSAEQMELAGIETGLAGKRIIHTYHDCTGTIEVPPQNKASVHSPVMGFVREIRFLEGDYVKKGTVLAVVAHPDIIRLQREFLESKGSLEWLEQDLKRKESLAGEDAVARKDKDKATSDYQIELARYKGIRAELAMIGMSVKTLEEEGTIQQSLALTAPVNGYITRISSHLGDLVSPGEPLYEMVDPAHVHVEMEVFAKDAGAVRPGQTVECWVPGTEEMYLASVHLVGREVDQDTKTVRIHGHFKKEPKNLLPGTYVQARITTSADSVWAMRQTALVTENGESFIYVQKGDKFEAVAVATGRQDGEYIEVKLPVELQSQKLVLKGAYYIKGAAAAAEE